MKHISSFLAGSILLALTSGARAQIPSFSSSNLSVSGVNGAYAVAAGDFDGNGKPDLAVANYSSGTVTIWLGDGTGAYTQASGSPITAGAHVDSLAVTDLNGDGKADLVAVLYQSPGTNCVLVWLGNGNGTFQPVQPFTAGSAPESVVVGDFNRDGKPDLAIANFLSNTVSVFLNTTVTGATTVSFTAPAGSPFAAGSAPASIALADFDGDGNLDMAIADEAASGKVTVLLGSSSGVFSPASYSPINNGAFNFSVVAGDFNGDGKPDLAIASFGNDFLIVLLGSGTGFSAATGSPYTTGHGPVSVTTGDFNGDGYLDLATANYGGGNVSVFLGNGLGGFTAASGNPFSVGTNPQFILAGDFNLDGEPDLAVAVFGSNRMTLLLNTSPAITANPASLTFYAELAGQSAIAGASITSGGLGYSVNDILTAVSGGTGALFKVTALGMGGAVGSIIPIAVGQGYFVGQGLTFVGGTGSGLVAHVTAVGEAGVVPAPAGVPVSVNSTVAGFNYNAASNQPWLTPSPPSNATGSPSTVTLSASQGTMPAGTYNATARYTSPHFFGGKTNTVLNVSNPSGTLTPAANVNLTVPFPAFPTSVAVGDFNLDGKPDLAVAVGIHGNTVNVLLGDGAGGFSAPGSSFAAGASPYFVAVGDFNGDGKPDLVLANDLDSGTVTVLLGDGVGNFAAAPGSPFVVGGHPKSVAIGDFNGDGKADLAVANFTSGNVSILLGNGLGGFAPAPGSPIAVGHADSVAVGDFNGDGKQDLAALSNNGFVVILLGNGVGGFVPAPGSPFSTGNGAQVVVVADFNGDGKQDLASSNNFDNTVSVLLGDGFGGFNAAMNSPFSSGPSPNSLVVADLNGDGRPDLAVTNYTSSPPYATTILLGNGAGGFSQAAGSPFPAGYTPAFVATGDFNRDGRADLAVLNDRDQTITVLLGTLAPTTTALSGPFASPPFGTSVTFSAAIAGTGFNALTGNVTFLDEVGGTIGTTSLPAASQVVNVSSAGGQIEIGAPGHGLSTGQTVTITGVTGTTEANGTWTATLVLDSNHFTLTGSAFIHAYTGGGRVQPAAQFSTSSLNADTYAVSAVYSGDARNTQSTSNAFIITIAQAPQTINFPALPDVNYGVAPFTLTATVNSPLTVQYSPGIAGVCNVSGSLVTIVGVGQCTITASQPGDANHTTALTVTRSFQVILPPTADSVSPAAGTGTSQVFTFKYSSVNGSGYLNTVYSLINGAFSAAGGCYAYYVPASNAFYLYNDTASSVTGPLTPGSGGTLSNSQCTLNGMGSSASGSGSTLTVALSISFKPAFAGLQNIYGYATDNGSGASGWQTFGTWHSAAPVSTPPTADSVSPTSSTGTSQVFTFKYSSVNGSGYLSTVYNLINSSFSAAGGCYVYYVPASNAFYLYNDTASSVTGPLVPGSGGTLSNSQCTLNGTGSLATGLGNTLSVALSITFKPAFSGLQNLYGYAIDNGSNASGWQTLGTWHSAAPVSTPPTADSVSPSSGTGTSQVFTFKYSSVNGSGYLSTVYNLINGAFSAAGGCYVYYVPASNGFYMYNDTASSVTGPLVPGSGGTLSNSQCTLNGTGSSATGLGNTLSVALSITFKPAFSGLQNLYGYAIDNGSNASGWQTLGTWHSAAPVSTPPTADSVSPAAGTGTSQVFTFKYSSVNGSGYLNTVYNLINGAFSAAGGCYVYYVPASNAFYLYNDTGLAITGPLTPGSGGTLSNSQCTLNGSGSSVSGLGNTLTVALSINFKAAFSGVQNLYGYAIDNGSNASGWQTLGAWHSAAPVSTPPTADSVSPSSGAGTSQVFTFKYSSVNGSGYLSTVYNLINGTFSAAGGCYVYYVPASNAFYLYNDTASSVTGPLTPGSGGTLSNSQCTLNGTGSLATGLGNTLSVALSITFRPAFSGLQNLYGYAIDNGSNPSGWQTLGAWHSAAPVSTPPTADSVSPSSGTGTSQVFTFKYSSVNGSGYLSTVYNLINGAFSAAGGCYVYYVPASNAFYMYNDTASSVTGPLTPGSGGTLSNSQCTLNGPGTSATGSGNTLTVALSISFKAAFAGVQNLYGYAVDNGSNVSGWQTLGGWNSAAH